MTKMFERPNKTEIDGLLTHAAIPDGLYECDREDFELLAAEIRWLREQLPVHPMELLFHGRPGEEQHQFVAVRRPKKHLVELSTWTETDDGNWKLKIPTGR